MSTSKRNLVQRAVGVVAGYFSWVKETFASDTARRAVLADLGLDPDAAPPLEISGERVTSIDAYRKKADPDEQAFLAVWQDILLVVETVEAFVAAAGAGQGGKPVVKEAVRQFLSLTSAEYMRLRYPMAYFVARLFQVIEDVVPQQFHAPVDVVVSKDIFSNLLDVVSAPIDHFDRVYSTPTTDAEARELAANTLIPLGILLAYWDQTTRRGLNIVGVDFELPKHRVLHGWDPPPNTTTPLGDHLAQQMLSFSIKGPAAGGTAESPAVESRVGATLAWVPEDAGGPGLFVSVNGAADFNIPLGSVFGLNTKRSTSDVVDVLIWDSIDFKPQPSPTQPGEPGPVLAFAASAGTDAGEEIRFTIQPIDATAQDPFVLSLFGTRLELGQLSLSLLIARHAVELKFLAKKSALVIQRGDGDGFTDKAVPQQGARLDFDLGVGLVLSPELRVHVEGGSGLQVTIPIDRTIGPARLQQLYLALGTGAQATGNALRFEASLGFSLTFGPVVASVDRLGFEFIVDMDTGAPPRVGFKAPSGVGLAIDAKVVSGGGYLFRDAASGQYAGVVQLEFRKLTLQAIGLISTRLPPDGRRGFSMLVIVAAADFPPIQLPFGFRLTGVGGLVGVNRTVETEALRAGLKTGSLDNILFPANPVRDAPRIVSALATLTPPREGQFLLGLMARVVWGVPTLLTIELGIIVEFPSPTRLIVLGQFRAVMPTDKKVLVRIQMDALGVVDFDQDTAAIDAVLYDSKVVKYPVTGDMALRARWANDPTFALAVGGLHPKFTAPNGFPKLARVTIGLSQGKNTRLTLQAYLALTSNTAQVGARLDFFFKASSFTVEGGLGFDALFQFSPFSFIVDLKVGVTLKWHGRTLFGVDLEFTLSGPSPWHAVGKATFKIWRFSKSVSFDRTLGEETPPPPLPAADPLPELIAALADRRNWNAQVPVASAMLVTLRDLPPTQEVLLHPLGELAVRQRVVPLGIEISRFGNTTPSRDTRFDVAVVGAKGDPVEEFFAPAQFIDLADAERLRRPSFERMQAGVRVASTAVAWGGKDNPALIAETDLAYETVVIDGSAPPVRERSGFDASADDLRLAAALGAVGSSPMRRAGSERFRAPSAEVRLTTTRFIVTSADDLTPVEIADLPRTSASYTAAWQAMQRHLARHPEAHGKLQVIEVEVAA
jgi:hypothetical protein